MRSLGGDGWGLDPVLAGLRGPPWGRGGGGWGPGAGGRACLRALLAPPQAPPPGPPPAPSNSLAPPPATKPPSHPQHPPHLRPGPACTFSPKDMPSVPRGPPSLRPSAPGSTLRVPRTPTRWPDRRGPQAPRWRRAPRSVTPRQPRPRRRGGGRHPGPKSRSGHSKTHHRHSLRAWARAPRTHAGTRPRGGSADGQEWERNGIPDTVAAGPAAARAPDAAPGPAPLRRGGCLAPTGRVAQLRVPVSSFRLSVCVCVVGTCVCVPACATMGSGGAGGPGLALSQAG